MPRKLRIAYLAHSFRSDWNNGNAHFLRGLMRSMIGLGHDMRLFEPCTAWSIEHLREEEYGDSALRRFYEIYPELQINTYTSSQCCDIAFWHSALHDCDIVILHEWSPPELAHRLLGLRDQLGYRLLFHDTHHRASSSPDKIRHLGIKQFDGVIAFGKALRQIYCDCFQIQNVWILHEAADTTVFGPHPHTAKVDDVIWIGNWGDDERADAIRDFLLKPAALLHARRFAIYGVRYPQEALDELRRCGVDYRGYLSNIDAPAAYASARLTVHVPRGQYSTAMTGIPTIRVFEALASGIPLICSPWQDSEHLFPEGSFLTAANTGDMTRAIAHLLTNPRAAEEQALLGLETIFARHTCARRAEELTCICEELLH